MLVAEGFEGHPGDAGPEQGKKADNRLRAAVSAVPAPPSSGLKWKFQDFAVHSSP